MIENEKVDGNVTTDIAQNNNKKKLLATEKKKNSESLITIFEDTHFDVHAAEMATHSKYREDPYLLA